MLTESHDRIEMETAIQWLTPDSGLGYGVASFTGMLIHNMGPKISMMVVKGPTTKYRDEELTLLYDFSRLVDAKYPKAPGWNQMIFDHDYGWLRKRLSWEAGSMYSDSLPEAVAIFYPDIVDLLETRSFVFLTDTAFIGQITGQTPDKMQYTKPDYLTYVVAPLSDDTAQPVPGAEIMIARRIPAIYAPSFDSLRRQVLMALRHRVQKRKGDQSDTLARLTAFLERQPIMGHGGYAGCSPSVLSDLWKEIVSVS